MKPGDPNVARVEVVAEALGDLREELVFVGGCAASLLIDAPSAPPTVRNIMIWRSVFIDRYGKIGADYQ